jgi:hypothetical protein
MWEGRVAIDIRGPAGRQISSTVSFFERRSKEATLRKRLPTLPISSAAIQWREHFERYFRADKNVQVHYDPAQSCLIEFNADELGTFSLICEREFSPLRWIVRRKGREYELSLQDESGLGAPAHVTMFNFAEPDIPIRMVPPKISSPYLVPESGGLYRAHTDKYECAIIVAPVRKLQELKSNSQVRHGPRSAKTLEDLLVLIQLWSQARDTGLFSAARRQSVIVALQQEIFATISVGTGKPGPASRSNLTAQVTHDCVSFASLQTKDRVERFISAVQNTLHLQVVGHTAAGTPLRSEYEPDYPNWLCEFALRLASSPQTVQGWAGTNLRRGLQRLIETPDLARAAWLLVLAIDRYQQGSPAASVRQPVRWEWS